MTNAVNWFEIPVKNYERAKKFYTTILASEITDHPMPEQNVKYGIFTHSPEKNGVGGAIIEAEGQTPTKDGCTIYLNGGDDLSESLDKVEYSGGRVTMPKTNIGENGFIAQFTDTEGNKIALHSMS